MSHSFIAACVVQRTANGAGKVLLFPVKEGDREGENVIVRGFVSVLCAQ